MSWQDKWIRQSNGRYAYRDPTIDITYTIGEDLFKDIMKLDRDEREEFLVVIMSQAAEAIGRNALRDIR